MGNYYSSDADIAGQDPHTENSALASIPGHPTPNATLRNGQSPGRSDDDSEHYEYCKLSTHRTHPLPSL